MSSAPQFPTRTSNIAYEWGKFTLASWSKLTRGRLIQRVRASLSLDNHSHFIIAISILNDAPS